MKAQLVSALKSKTGALANLIYHKFDSLESEQFFIQVISDVLDLFMDEEGTNYVEFFKENNSTYEEHPARKEAEAAHEKRRKESLIRMLHNMKIEDFDESMTADELQEIYNRETELMIQNQIKPSSEDDELVIEDSEYVETGEVSIEPTIKIEKNSLYGEMGNPTEACDAEAIEE